MSDGFGMEPEKILDNQKNQITSVSRELKFPLYAIIPSLSKTKWQKDGDSK
jgi:hypothetical protein